MILDGLASVCVNWLFLSCDKHKLAPAPKVYGALLRPYVFRRVYCVAASDML